MLALLPAGTGPVSAHDAGSEARTLNNGNLVLSGMPELPEDLTSPAPPHDENALGISA